MCCGFITPTIAAAEYYDSINTYIPWYQTSNMDNARKTLMAMYNHFDDSSSIKAFIEANCTHLMETPVGNTGVSTSYFDRSN